MKTQRDSIKAVEVVQVRLFETNDGPKVVGIFHRETGSSQEPLPATLYQSPIIANDWSIYFWRTDPANPALKSLPAVRCAVLLQSIGYVDHAVWQQVIGSETRKNHLSLERPTPE